MTEYETIITTPDTMPKLLQERHAAVVSIEACSLSGRVHDIARSFEHLGDSGTKAQQTSCKIDSDHRKLIVVKRRNQITTKPEPTATIAIALLQNLENLESAIDMLNPNALTT